MVFRNYLYDIWIDNDDEKFDVMKFKFHRSYSDAEILKIIEKGYNTGIRHLTLNNKDLQERKNFWF